MTLIDDKVSYYAIGVTTLIFLYTFSFMVLLSSFGKPKSVLNSSKTSSFLIFAFILLVVVQISLTFNRIIGNAGSDMSIYTQEFINMHGLSFPEILKSFDKEWFFLLFQWFVSLFTSSQMVFIICLWLLYSFILTMVLKQMFLPWQRIFVFFAYLNFPFFYSYIFNGSRQGIAMMFILLAIGYWINQEPKKYKFYLSIVSSVLFHSSALPAVVALFLVKKLKLSLKFLVISWLVCSLVFFIGLNHSIYTNVLIRFTSSQKYISYLNNDVFAHGTRIDFYLFSAFWIALSLVLYRFVIEEKKEIYLKLIKCYIALNIYYLLFSFIPYSDRVASYSWFTIPILVLYPLLNLKKYSTFATVSINLVSLVIGIFTTIQFYK